FQRHVVQGDEVTEALRHRVHHDAHGFSSRLVSPVVGAWPVLVTVCARLRPPRSIRFIANNVARPTTASTNAAAYAPATLNVSYCLPTYSGRVSVTPEIFPDTTATAPNSPRARAVASTTP